MSKDLFLMMREQEITQNFPTKKEVKANGKKFAKEILDSGNHNIKEVYSQALRLKESLTEIEIVLKEALGEEGFEAFGLKASFSNGGNIPNYSEDEVYADLSEKLKKRKQDLDIALKQQEEYTKDKIYVPLVSTKPRKSSLRISF